MTTRAAEWFEKRYISGVQHVLQSEGYLTRGMTKDTDNIKGDKAVWKFSGRGEVTEHPKGHSKVPLMNVDRSNIEAELKDWDADDAFKTRDMDKMSENERLEIEKSGAMAIGRQYDNILWDALVQTPNVDGGSGASLINPSLMLTSKAKIAGKQRAMGQLFCAVPDMVMENWKMLEAFSSSTWKGPAGIVDHTTAVTWGGVHFFVMEDEFFTKFAHASGDIYLPVWHKDCVGRVMNGIGFEGIHYRPDEKDWRVSQRISGVAKILLSDGVRLVRGAMPTSVTSAQ